MFFQIRNDMYIEGCKHTAAKQLFIGKDSLFIRTFPTVYQTIFDVCQTFILDILASVSKSEHDMEVIEENEAQLMRMHGWVLHELSSKSKFQGYIETFILQDKTNIPKAMQLLDVGTKTGLIFVKYEFKPFMNASDLFVRKVLSDENFITYGKNILEVAKTPTQNHLQLQKNLS